MDDHRESRPTIYPPPCESEVPTPPPPARVPRTMSPVPERADVEAERARRKEVDRQLAEAIQSLADSTGELRRLSVSHGERITGLEGVMMRQSDRLAGLIEASHAAAGPEARRAGGSAGKLAGIKAGSLAGVIGPVVVAVAYAVLHYLGVQLPQ